MNKLIIDLDDAPKPALLAAMSALNTLLSQKYNDSPSDDIVADATVGVVGKPEEQQLADTDTSSGTEQSSGAEVPVSNLELDEDGIQWDERIHASSRAKNADGRWKKRKMPTDLNKEQWKERISEVEDELLGVSAGVNPQDATVDTPAAPVSDTPPPPPAAAPVPPAAQTLTMTEKAGGATYESFVDQGWTDQMMIDQGYAVAATGAPAPALTWPEFMAKLQKGEHDIAKLNDLLKADGIELQELAAKPDFLPRYAQELGL